METLEQINDSFRHNWEANRGPEQTQFFMRIILENLPADFPQILDHCQTICDAGCALGDGVKVLADSYPAKQVWGIDISDVAIDKCKQRFPEIQFYNVGLGLSSMADLTICSNVLEHFDNPFPPFIRLLSRTLKAALILTPYKEGSPMVPGHHCRVNENTLPESIEVMRLTFRKAWWKIIDTTGHGVWDGEQILQCFLSDQIETE